MYLYLTCEHRTLALPLTSVPVSISRPDWVEEVIPHLDDEHAETLAEWLGDSWAWDTIEYNYTDGSATAGRYMAADGRECTWTMMLYGEPVTRAELRQHLNPEA
jgi:hypothetical protein